MIQDENNSFKILLIGSIAFFLIIIAFVISNFKEPGQQEATSAIKEFDQYSEKLVEKAQRGDAEAQYSLGNCYFYGFGVAKDQREAVKWLRKAAEQGHASAQNDLGHCYYSGAGVERNQAEAEKWWKKASEGRE